MACFGGHIRNLGGGIIVKIKIKWDKDKFKSDVNINADSIRSHWVSHIVDWVIIAILLVIFYWQTPVGKILPQSTVTVGNWILLMLIYILIYFGAGVLVSYVFGYIALLYRWIRKRGK